MKKMSEKSFQTWAEAQIYAAKLRKEKKFCRVTSRRIKGKLVEAFVRVYEKKIRFLCEHCKKEIPIDQINKFIASRAGSGKSKIKSAQSVINGAKGGRPKKSHSQT